MDRGADGCCVVDVRGVGYEVFVPNGSAQRLPPPPEPVTLHVHTHVREDTFTLFGFESKQDRAAFRAILSVSNVGPKTALAVLGALSAQDLAAAVTSGDKAALKAIPGVGPKTSERLVLELKDKLGFISDGRALAPARPAMQVAVGPLASVANALVRLGYKPGEAEQAVASLEVVENQPMETLLKKALAALVP